MKMNEGLRLTAKQKIDEAIAGTPLMITGSKPEDQAWCLRQLAPFCERNALWLFHDAKRRGVLPPLGVHVQTPTYGSLEAMLEWMAAQVSQVRARACMRGGSYAFLVVRVGCVLCVCVCVVQGVVRVVQRVCVRVLLCCVWV